MQTVCDSALDLTTVLADLSDQVDTYTELLDRYYDKRKEDEARIKDLEDKNEELNTQWKDKMAAALEELDMAQQMLADHRVTNVRSHRLTPTDEEEANKITSAQQYEIEMLEAERNKLRNELAEVTARLNRSDIPLEMELEKKEALLRSLQRDLNESQDLNQDLAAEISQLKIEIEMAERRLDDLRIENEDAHAREEELMVHIEELRAQTLRPSLAPEGETLEDLGDSVAPGLNAAISVSMSEPAAEPAPKMDFVISTTPEKTEIHYHIHNHAHGHTHQHDHQHDHYHQYGVLSNPALRSMGDAARVKKAKPVALSMTQGDAIYSSVDLDLKNKLAQGVVITGKKKRVKKNITTLPV